MKKILILFIVALFATSCGVQSLYYWGGEQKGTTKYENLAYLSYDKQTPESICNLICVYEDMVTKPSGIRQVPPPGICAEYGYLLLLPQTAEIFMEHASSSQKKIFNTSDYVTTFRERGEEMMKKEMELYPESIQFIKPIFIKLTK